MKQDLFYLFILLAFSSCTMNETIRINEPRINKYDRYGYGTGPSELIVTATQDYLITVNNKTETAHPGKLLVMPLPIGFYNIKQTEASLTLTTATPGAGFDLEVYPNRKYKTRL